MKGRISIIAWALVLLTATAAVASEAEGGHHGMNWLDLMWRLINFALFVGIIYWFGGKKIAELFRGRKQQIETQLSDFTARRRDAETKLKEVEASIANIENERAKILEEFKAQGEKLKQSIIAAAEDSAAKIVKQAEATAEQERRTARKQIRADVADMVIEAAEKILAEKLGKDEHEKLVDEYLTKVVLN